MKTIFTLLISFVFLTTSCNNDDDSLTDMINGIWQLKDVSGGLLGINIDYNQGDVYWTFNRNGILAVENNILTDGPESIHARYQSGEYPYEVKLVDGEEKLFIEDTNQGSVYIRDGLLFVDGNLALDGLIMRFDK